jgi:NADPH-dependent F420 reductase
VKIGIIGGTGEIGEGMAMRLSQTHDVWLGSRDVTKAGESSSRCRSEVESRGLPCSLWSGSNQEAADFAEIAIIAIPFTYLIRTLGSLTGLEGKVVVSPVNPVERDAFFTYARPPEGSAAELVQRLLPDSRIVAAFNTVAANRWKALDEPLEYAVPVCADDAAAKQTVMDLVTGVPRLKGYDTGPLGTASLVESITPLLLNVARFNRMRDVGIQFR